ncbi:Helix-turn-helix domain containing protein [uncultured Caudovirales phage]|uniref:Helix-turn-helix domain containing protein n=1 Tax=uncultured Caudovirales phage TaxID=2100421 RepID=A0A6J5NIC8_9CAUD|nr:Helix-turn-helix domain containing protein [uncultured Caudovirales phage]
MELNLLVSIRDDRSLPTGYHKAVLYALATRGQNVYPNQEQLMKDSGIGSRNTLVKIVKDLETLGWLTITKKKHGNNQYKNNRYEVHVPNVTNPCITSDETIVNIDTLKINKDKRKINISVRNQGKAVFNHTSISSFLAESPVSGVYNKEINNG